MARKKRSAEKKAKSVPITRLVDANERDAKILGWVADLIRESHDDLVDADIAVCWHWSWKADADGRVRMAELKRTGPLERAVRQSGEGRDFTLLLNHSAYTTGVLSEGEAIGWIDNALCAGVLSKDSEGYPKHDEEGEKIYRTRRPDVSLFLDAYERHGPISKSLGALRNAVVGRMYEDRPLLAMFDMQPSETEADGVEA